MTMTSVDDMSLNMTSDDDAAENSHDMAESSRDAAESSHDAAESSHDSSHDLTDDYENCKTDDSKNIRKYHILWLSDCEYVHPWTGPKVRAKEIPKNKVVNRNWANYK